MNNNVCGYADDDFVFFWKLEQENEEFSNFYPCIFKIEGIRYNCVEQYMMSRKALLFGDTDIFNAVINESDPDKIKSLGRLVKGFDPDKWDRCKWEIVYNGNRAKYEQNPKLRNKLIRTGNAVLAEASPYDKIWGIGLDRDDPLANQPDKWKGENLLGKILGELREEFTANGSHASHRKSTLKLGEAELDLLRTVDRKTLEDCIRDISDIEKIEWGGGCPTGDKDEQGKDIIQWPFPKYPECVFPALSILGSDYSYMDTINEVLKIDPNDMDLFQMKTFLTGMKRQERFCDGLIAGYIEDGTVLICLEKILYLLDCYDL